MESSPKPLKLTSLTVADAARVLSSASGREITEDQVREIAERGGLVADDGTINLIEYVAFLVREVTKGGVM